jgi:hypothetical protein
MIFSGKIGKRPYKFWTDTNRAAKEAGLDEITKVTVLMAKKT